MNISNILNNREIATAIWSIALFLWALSINDFRCTIPGLLKAFFVKKIIFTLLAMLLYIFFMVVLAKKMVFWDTSALKDTILWTTGTALVALFNLSKDVNDEHYFKKAILDNIKLILVIEFIVNLYSFNLVAELLIVPITTIIVMLNTIANTKAEYKQVKNLLNFVLGILGLIIIGYTIKEIIIDFQNFATLKNLRDFLLPPLFTIAFLPFVYMLALYMHYDTIFMRVDFATKDVNLAKYTKQKILSICNINLSKLGKLSKNIGLPNLNNKNDVFTLLKKGQ